MHNEHKKFQQEGIYNLFRILNYLLVSLVLDNNILPKKNFFEISLTNIPQKFIL